MPVPLLDIAQHNRPYLETMKAALGEWLESGQYIGGPNVTGLEQELASYLGVSDCIAVSSGTDALLLALMALDLGPGDEVICPSFTFFATAGVVSRLGATPVFADLLPASFNVDPNDVAKKVTPKTKAIIPVHLFGQMAEMEALEAIASTHRIPIIEDCAQAIGASRHGRKAGTIGVFGSFSFYPTKNLSGFGDGGFLCCNDDALTRRARILRIHGMDPVYYHSEVGGNFRFDPVQGALLRLKLPDLDSQNALRDRNAQHYQKRMLAHKDISTSDRPHPEARILLPSTSPGNNHTWHQFTIRVQGSGVRDALLQWLKERKIGCGVYYPLGLHRQVCFQKIIPQGNPLPETERASAEVISLPIFPELTLDQLDEVSDAILAFLNR